MTNKNRNLAQKWRAKTFAQIVGQQLSIRMLQNSLYANRIFPVYLFSGNRGCGKTSTARIFAASLNCRALDVFRKDPKTQSIPCLSCDSCIAMSRHEHPDFIEMDAASHTGVDNVRDIIDAASLVPVLGRMRIYLLDEAHMLSKAAFNAFLKVLEEPPMSVVFILATTDPQKIIDTVRSRCFNVFFNPVAQEQLIEHLHIICVQEGIEADQEGLARIAQNSQGCVRDAITLIEQVWYAHARVTQHTVVETLGMANDAIIIAIVQALLQADMQALIAGMMQLGDHYDPMQFLQALAMALRLGIWYQLKIPQSHIWYQDQLFINVITAASQQRLIDLLQQAADVELVLAKAINKKICLETFLLRACNTKKTDSIAHVGPSNTPLAEPKISGPATPVETAQQVVATPPLLTDQERRWQQFVALIQGKGDNLLYSIFKQGRCLHYDQDNGQIDMVLPDSLLLFKDMVEQHKLVWSAFLEQAFEKPIGLTIIFDAHAPVTSVELKPIEKNNTPIAYGNQTQSNNIKKNNYGTSPSRPKAVTLDVSDTQKWQKTSLVLEFFPGTVTKVGESS